MSELGENIKRERLKRGMTQSELASILGVSDITVSRYETGQREPNMDMLFKISDVLNIGLDALAGITLNDDFDDPNYQSVLEDMAKEDIVYNDRRIEKLINDFDTVNETGKKKILSYSDDIASNPKYTKEE